MISRRVAITLAVLLVTAPVFGIFLAEVTGYHEPLDIVAEELGLTEEELQWTPFKDYTFPGLPDWLGYIVTGLIGVLLIVATCYAVKYFVVGGR